jgi:tRNA pseudouridine32 synthase/23S rRNA pseudouridine746 synthase
MVEVIARSSDLLVVDKPSGVSLFADRTGAPALWPDLQTELEKDHLKPLQVHRLDKGTSGVLFVALSKSRQAALNRAFARAAIRKFYVARVAGSLDLGRTGIIDLPLKPGRKSRYRVAGPRASIQRDGSRWHLETPADDGFESVTRLRVIASTRSTTTVLLAPATGRTHQLRVHLSWIGHPILGDHLYGRPGSPEQQAPRLALHCHKLTDEQGVTYTAPLPWTLREA